MSGEVIVYFDLGLVRLSRYALCIEETSKFGYLLLIQ